MLAARPSLRRSKIPANLELLPDCVHSPQKCPSCRGANNRSSAPGIDCLLAFPVRRKFSTRPFRPLCPPSSSSCIKDFRYPRDVLISESQYTGTAFKLHELRSEPANGRIEGSYPPRKMSFARQKLLAYGRSAVTAKLNLRASFKLRLPVER